MVQIFDERWQNEERKLLQKQAWGDKQILKIIPKVTENGPAKFGKYRSDISGALTQFGKTVSAIFERGIQLPMLFSNEVSDSVLKTRREILLLEITKKRPREHLQKNIKKLL